ncbi:MAG: hypothetical protein ABSG87_08185 [Verrucomicrobiota bacterium]
MVNWLLAKFAKVWVLGKPVEIAIAKMKCFFQSDRGMVKLLGERVAAGKVVKNERIAGSNSCETFVHFKPVNKATAACVVVAQKLKRIHVFGIAADKSLHEFDPRIEVALFRARHFFSGTAFDRHTTWQVWQPTQPSQVAECEKLFMAFSGTLRQNALQLP